MLFVAVPLAFAWARLEGVRASPILAMIVIAIPCALYLRRQRRFDHITAWRAPRPRYHLRPVIGTFLLLAPLMGAILWSIDPQALFSFPRQRPEIWLVVMALYPVFSVTPQSIIWRGFLLHRYRPLIGAGWPAVLIATAAFSFAHIFFLNGVALLVTLVGGLLFVLTYLRSGSLVLSIVEHAMYGCWAFTVGYGRFLYGGSMHG